jgi:hypothetical protein
MMAPATASHPAQQSARGISFQSTEKHEPSGTGSPQWKQSAGDIPDNGGAGEAWPMGIMQRVMSFD